MGRRIREIKGRMSSLVADAQQMNLLYAASSLQQQPPSTSTSQTDTWRKSSVMERDSRPVAIDEKVEAILSLLADASVSVIAVVGMGGVGKTFLLQHVYSKAKATSMFQNEIWLSISQSYSILQLQRDLASKINLINDVVNISEIQAQEVIHERLTGTKSLIVLDDVWRAEQRDDLIAKLGLPVGNNSECKVIVTTRDREVCRSMNARIYEMEHFSEEDSWELFCAYAFFDGKQNSPPAHLEEIAWDMAKKCANLPLAIKTVASSMAHSRVLREWEEKLHQLEAVKVNNPKDPIMKIIKLSYDPLPWSLRHCLDYLSFFPEDEEIDCEYLVYLWMTEGFIPHADVGWGYLRQFANLCLVEVWENDFLVKKCKIHDLVLDLAVSIPKEINKCVFKMEEVSQSGCLRVLLGKQGLHDDAIAQSNFSRPPSVRTLSFFNNSFLVNIPPKLFSQVRMLRVLDLSQTALSSLPESVGNLKLLKVLNLSDTKIEQVPRCVAKLKSLRFLDVSGCRDLVEVTKWIGELTCLQHLNIQHCSKTLWSRGAPKGISKLLSLQTLRSDYLTLVALGYFNMYFQDLANLTDLRELRINVKKDWEMDMLELGILKGLVHMRILGIRNELETANEAEQRPFPETMKYMKDLEQLFLYRFALPSWIHGFANLRKLLLENCDCSDYSALTLETMPNLTRLELFGNKRCRELPKAFGNSRAFPNLRFLSIEDFCVLEEFWGELEDGAMAGLEKLHVYCCLQIKNVPQGLEQLKSLKELKFCYSGTEEVRERLREDGVEWTKIKANNRHVRVLVEP